MKKMTITVLICITKICEYGWVSFYVPVFCQISPHPWSPLPHSFYWLFIFCLLVIISCILRMLCHMYKKYFFQSVLIFSFCPFYWIVLKLIKFNLIIYNLNYKIWVLNILSNLRSLKNFRNSLSQAKIIYELILSQVLFQVFDPWVKGDPLEEEPGKPLEQRSLAG